MSLPNLRFPEFRNAPEWIENPIGKLLTIGGGKDYKHLSKGDIPVYGTGGYMLSVDEYLHDGESVCIGRKGTIDKPVFLSGKFWTVDTLFYTHSFKKCLPKFIYLCFQNINWSNYNEASGVPSLSKATIANIEIQVPSIPEQQKIVDCLSSIDELITAQTQKLDTLKTHKKGLMQQLFPAEGETVPKLRFPEFRDAGEWILREFSKYIVLYRGSSPRPIENYLTSDSSGVNWIKIGDTKYAENFVINQVKERITPEGAKKSRKVNVGELILANSMSYGKTYQISITGYIYDGWFVLRDYEKHFNKQFLLQLLNSEYMQNQYERLSAGGIVQNISSDIVYQTVLPNTSLKEQEKIADCLASVDALIAAQAQKIEALKQHKKGLMQQLFPAAEEVAG